MANKYNLREIGVIYLDEVPQGNFPTEQPFTGILGWDGSNLVVKSNLQGPVFTNIPSYDPGAGTLALAAGQSPAYAPVYNLAQQSLEVYEQNDTVVIPTYSVVTGDYRLRDSQGNDYVPRTSVAAQNVAIIGSANVNLIAPCVGGIFLKQGTVIDGISTAYMSGSAQQGTGVLVLCASNSFPASQQIVTSWTLNLVNLPPGRQSVAMDIVSATVPADGWYDLILSLTSQDPAATVDVFGLRLVVT